MIVIELWCDRFNNEPAVCSYTNLLPFGRYWWLVFTIFIFMQNKGQNETQVILITVTYWIKLLFSHASTMIMVYMNVLQFDVCSNCCVLVYRFLTYWEIYEMQYLGYLSVRRYNSVNSISTAHPVVFQMPLLMPLGMCQVHACCSCVLSLHLSHCALELEFRVPWRC